MYQVGNWSLWIDGVHVCKFNQSGTSGTGPAGEACGFSGTLYAPTWNGVVSNAPHTYEFRVRGAHGEDDNVNIWSTYSTGSIGALSCSAAPTTGTIQGYKVLMPGNNQTAVPPANETVTLDIPSNNTYQASTDFSSTQGQNNWSYLFSIGGVTGAMFYDSGNNRWSDTTTFCGFLNNNIIWNLGAHPGSCGGSRDAVRRWTAPGSGNAHITGSVFDAAAGGGNGVLVTIKKNGVNLWQQAIFNNTKSYDLNTPVSSGDNIDFQVNDNGGNTFDSTGFDPRIEFASGSQTNLNPYFFNNTSVGNHTVSVSVPAGWSVGHTLCYNETTCHNNVPTPGNTATVNVPAGGFADLWWHYTSSTVTADIRANGTNGPITIDYNTDATISWSSGNATSCTVSPTGWTGISGSQSTNQLTSSKTYILNCSGPGGSASDSVTVNVSTPPGPTVSCVSNPSGTALLGHTVIWTAMPSGGTPPFAYSWSGTNIPTSPAPNTHSFSIVYSTIGQKTAIATVTDDNSLVTSCNGTVGNGDPGLIYINFDPTLEEF
ncbi:MAG: hypothetical protein Q7K26_02850 [bacterium]|nr:hypothetical protein [bacterium]